MNPRRHLALAAAIIAAAVLTATGAARACVICIPYPTKTAADHVIESEIVLFGRENPEAPLTFSPVETVKGHYTGSAIHLLVDAATARILRLDPTATAVLAQDRVGSEWTYLGVAGPVQQAVLREVATWESHSKSPRERALFFASYLEHEDRGLANLAFLEVGRAPYATIRDLAVQVKREAIYAVINNWFRIEWHGLYILMLGVSDRRDDIMFVHGRLEALAQYGTTNNLAAYATAFIEMTGTDGVKELASVYFADASRGRDELIEILKALSVQGNSGRTDLHPAIVDAYGGLLSIHPELAGHVASDLSDWEVSRLVPRVRDILNSDVQLDEASQLALTTYLRSASRRP